MQKKQTLKRSESVAFCGLAIALITIGAWVTVPLGPVPFTLQTMVLAFVVLLFPAREAVASVAGYVVLGALGVPVFSGMAGGLAKVMGPTGGFIIGFVLGAIAAVLVLKAWKAPSSKVLGLGSRVRRRIRFPRDFLCVRLGAAHGCRRHEPHGRFPRGHRSVHSARRH